MSIKQAIEALEELVEYAEEAGFNWSLDNARAAIAALRSMPQGEPVATIRYERGTPGKENDMPKVVSCNWLPDGVYSVYATPHTEAVRMSEAEILALWSGSEVATRPVLGSKKVITFARAVEQATAARLGVTLTSPERER